MINLFLALLFLPSIKNGSSPPIRRAELPLRNITPFGRVPMKSIPQASVFIDPTGTYLLKGLLHKGKISGHFGEIRARLIDSAHVLLSFDINQGFPENANGFFSDTLPYNGIESTFIPPADTLCTIVFVFSPQAVETKQWLRDPHCSCGFEKGLMVSARFSRYSAEAPYIRLAR